MKQVPVLYSPKGKQLPGFPFLLFSFCFLPLCLTKSRTPRQFKSNNTEMQNVCRALPTLATQPDMTGGFVGDTLVKTPKGYLPIRDLAAGDLVWAVDEQGKPQQRKILHTQSKIISNLCGFTLCSPDGTKKQIILTAPCQKFFNLDNPSCLAGSWVAAKDLPNIKVADNQGITFNVEIQKDLTPGDTLVYSIGIDANYGFCVTEENLLVLSDQSKIIEGFVADTLVKTPSGHIPISKLKIGDTVVTVDTNGNPQERKITHTHSRANTDICSFELTSPDGQQKKTLLSAPFQRFFYLDSPDSTKSEWLAAKNITSAKVVNHTGILFNFVAKQNPTPQRLQTYSISVDVDHNFFITTDNILVHNFAPAIPLLNIAWGSGGMSFIWPSLATVVSAVVWNIVNYKKKPKDDPNKKCSGNCGGGNGPEDPKDPKDSCNHQNLCLKPKDHDEGRCTEPLGHRIPPPCPNPKDHEKCFWDTSAGKWTLNVPRIARDIGVFGSAGIVSWVANNSRNNRNNE